MDGSPEVSATGSAGLASRSRRRERDETGKRASNQEEREKTTSAARLRPTLGGRRGGSTKTATGRRLEKMDRPWSLLQNRVKAARSGGRAKVVFEIDFLEKRALSSIGIPRGLDRPRFRQPKSNRRPTCLEGYRMAETR